MTPESSRKVWDALGELLPLSPHERTRKIEEMSRDDPALAAEIELLLADYEMPTITALDNAVERVLQKADDKSRSTSNADPIGHFGPYQVLEQIGAGGMGQVYRVRDGMFRRSLAVKVLSPQHKDNANLKQRFLEEAELMGQLQHPGVPPVHNLGELPDGRPYFAMKLIKGRTLAALLKERTGPDHDLPRFLGIFEQLCRTLGYAHSQRIIHRDLKPLNVMVGAFGEVQVMDWGLAKVLSQAPERTVPEQTEPTSVISTVRTESTGSWTQAGQAMGTPAYMAPEQARGDVDELDQRCDVFGLGAILCEVLTGQPPYIGTRIIQQAQGGLTVEASRRLENCAADPELLHLARTCLATDKYDRPRDAGLVLRAITNYTTSVQQRLRQAELDRKAAEIRTAEERKRRRMRLSFVGAVAVFLAVIGAGAWWIDHSTTQQRVKREEQQARAKDEIESLFEQAETAMRNNLPEQTATLIQVIEGRFDTQPSNELARRHDGLVRDLEMSERLDAIFEKRWQIYQSVAVEIVLCGRKGPNGKAIVSQFDRGPDIHAITQEFESAFREYGIDVVAMKTDEAAKLVHGSRIRSSLIDALNQWFLLERTTPKLAALLACADADNVRHSVRTLVSTEKDAGSALTVDRDRLASYAKEDPSTIIQIVDLLPDQRAIELLNAALDERPQDYRLRCVLVNRLLLIKPSRAKEAVEHARVAHALKPAQNLSGFLLVSALSKAGLHDNAIRLANKLGGARSGREPDLLFSITLGDAYQQMGDNSSAIEQFQKAAKQRQDNAYVYFRLGFLFNEKRRYQEAITALEKSIVIDPKLVDSYMSLGWSYTKTKDIDKAIDAYEQLLVLEPNNYFALKNLGWELIETARYAESIKLLDKAIGIDPNHPDAYNCMGYVYAMQANHDEAIKWYMKCLERDHNHVCARVNLGSSFNETKRYDEAIQWLEQAIELEPEHPLALCNLGVSYVGKKQYDRGISLIEKAIKLDPENARVCTCLGFALNKTGKYSEAIKWLKKSIEIDPKYTPAYVSLGSALNHTDQFDEAIKWLNKAIKIDPKNSMAYNNLGWAFINKGEYDEAIKWLNKAIEINPKNSIAYNNLGSAFNQTRRFDEAIKSLNKAIEIDPKNSMAYNNLGWAFNQKRQFDEAIKSLQKAVQENPKYAKAYNNLGLALAGKKQFDEAIEWFNKAVEIDPKNSNAYANLGWAFINKREYDEAIKWLNKAIEINPKNSIAYNNLGSAFNETGQFDEAIKWLNKAIENDPKNSIAYNNLGWAFNQKRQFDEAIKSLNKAVEIDPKNSNSYTNLGWAFINKGEYDEAIKSLNKAVQADPKNAPAYNYLGVALSGKSRFDEAITSLKKSIEIDPKNLMAYNNLGLALSGKNQFDEAIEWFNKAVEIDPKNSTAYTNLGWTFINKGEYDEAIKRLNIAVEIDRKNSPACNNLGFSFFKKGEYDEAIKWLNKALEIDPKNSNAASNLEAAVKAQNAKPISVRFGVRRDAQSSECKIERVTNESPADKAGLKAGDVIIKFGDQQIRSYEDLVSELKKRKPGDEVEVVIKRGDSTMTLKKVPLEKRP